MPKKRLYSDKEISAVLKRAAEMQRSQGPVTTSGLSLDEMEQVAADVGIDPAYIKAAAAELEAGRTDKAFHFWGGPTSIELDRIVDGRMSPAVWEELVAEVRKIFGVVGETGQVGRSLEWTYRDQTTGERMHLTVTPAGKQTRIRFFMRLADWAAALHAPALSVSTVLIILQFILLHLGPVIEMGLALFLLGAVFMLARLAFGAVARSQERKARKLLARLDDLIEEPNEALRDVVDVPVETPSRIDATLLSGEETPERAQPARRREREGGS